MYSLVYICTIFVQCPQKQERNSLDLLLLMLVTLLMRALGPEPVSFPEQKVLLAEPSALVPFTSTFEEISLHMICSFYQNISVLNINYQMNSSQIFSPTLWIYCLCS